MTNETIAKTLDASGLQCPMPVIKTRKFINQIEVGEVWKLSPVTQALSRTWNPELAKPA